MQRPRWRGDQVDWARVARSGPACDGAAHARARSTLRANDLRDPPAGPPRAPEQPHLTPPKFSPIFRLTSRPPCAIMASMRKRLTARKALLENAKRANPMSIPDLARHCGFAVTGLYTIQTRLRREGLLPSATRAGGPSRIKHFETFSQLAMDAALEATGPRILPEERRPARSVGVDGPAADWPSVEIPSDTKVATELEWLQKLSYLMRFGSEQIQLNAAKALQDIARSTQSSIGPPPPLTEDQRVARLARLLMAIGQPTTISACIVAFPQEAPSEAAPPQNPTSPLPAPSGSDLD